MVTKAEVADLYVFDGNDGIMLEVEPDPSTWPRIHEAWDAFAHCVATSQPPPLSERDARLRDDPEWLSASSKYLELRSKYDELSAKVDEAKALLTALASHAKEQGGGVSVTRVFKRGNIDYKKIPELRTLDLERFRSASREEVRVTLA